MVDTRDHRNTAGTLESPEDEAVPPFDHTPDGQDAEPEPVGEPAASRPARRDGFRWRRYLIPRLTAVAVIAVSIWYLQSGRSLPFIGGSGSDAAQVTPEAGTAGFVTFGSRGIKLGPSSGVAPKIGEAAPDFTLLDVNGALLKLSDLRGKTVVMNFWATWCPPCRKEFPTLIKLSSQNAGAGLVVLGVDMQESPEIVRSFLDEFGATYPVVIDSKGDVASGYRLLGLPTTYFIAPDGFIRAQHVGELTESILTKKLAETGFSVAKGQQ